MYVYLCFGATLFNEAIKAALPPICTGWNSILVNGCVHTWMQVRHAAQACHSTSDLEKIQRTLQPV